MPTMEDAFKKNIQDLLSVPSAIFDELLLTTLTSEQGIYAIWTKNGECLHAGRSQTAGLRGRMKSHFTGGGKGAGSDLVQKVQDNHLATNRNEAQAWIRDNCLVRSLIVKDPDIRKWSEHLLLGTLRPKWGC
jgi:hypothetical protein